MRKQTSAIERLFSLPPLFRGGDLTVRFQWTSKTASHYIYLWKQRGFVQSLGGHSDVFANLLVNPSPNWEEALVMAMPSATMVGVEVLLRAGWVTQIQQRPSVAVMAGHPRFATERFTVVCRQPQWFAQVADAGGLCSGGGAPALKPAWALADMLATEGWGACGLHPDDLDLDCISSEDEDDWVAACAAFGLELGPLESIAVPSR